MCETIIKILSSIKSEHVFDKDTLLFDSGLLDSFDLLVLVSEIESQLKISIPGDGLIPENFSSPHKVSKYIESIKG